MSTHNSAWKMIEKILRGVEVTEYNYSPSEANEYTIARLLQKHERDLYELKKRVASLEIEKGLK